MQCFSLNGPFPNKLFLTQRSSQCTQTPANTVDQHGRPRLFTCGEDNVLGDEFVVNNRKLWQLYSVDSGHGSVSASPIKLDIICGVAICKGETKLRTLRGALSSPINGP